ncbi:selenide, water dikinase SelD [Candidatus Epulonipiscioides saccharophilum]|nr:selenide, water dikinase SelD [Epulopiscium sp. SCG-B10WGA-EpuloB]
MISSKNTHGGCACKIPSNSLHDLLANIKTIKDPNLLVGYDSSDDASVYKLTDNLAIVQTLDFFKPIVPDPYTFGQIAATNALSDIYAMGGHVITAQNIVCFPKNEDLNVLKEILRGGNDKLLEAGVALSGGHSIYDESIKYGLSVTGTVDPNKVYKNNSVKTGDALILTKPLGVGIASMAYNFFQAEENQSDFTDSDWSNRKASVNLTMAEAISHMTTLNKYASEIASDYSIHAMTDITGFGFIGHLLEMLGHNFGAIIYSKDVPVITSCVELASDFFISEAGQVNRNNAQYRIASMDIDDDLSELLFDPQTSGGLLISIPPFDAPSLLAKLKLKGLKARCVGHIIDDSNMITIL